MRNAPELDYCWHLRYDLEGEHVGGQAVKNKMLDEINDGWVWVLDDDTKVHPRLFLAAAETIRQGYQALVVAQKRKDGSVLHAHPDNVRVGRIDIGQAVITRSLIGEQRIPESHDGDGHFLNHILADHEGIRFLDRILSYHNKLCP